MSFSSFISKINSFCNFPKRNNVKDKVSFTSHLASSARYKHWYSIFQRKLEMEVEAKKVEPAISVAIVKLSLDNLVDNLDVKDICDSNSQLVSCSDFDAVENCQFCKKQSRLLDLCCPIKELQVGVFKKAITNSLRRHSAPHFIGKEPYSDQLKENWISPSEPRVLKRKGNLILDISKGKSTFLKLKKKLDNIRQFYPDLFYTKENIIDLWGKDDTLQLMTFEVLDYDENSKYVWI